jgi:hypothetical protein
MAMPNVGDFFSEFFERQIDLYHSAGYCEQFHGVRVDAFPRRFRVISIAEGILIAASHRIGLFMLSCAEMLSLVLSFHSHHLQSGRVRELIPHHVVSWRREIGCLRCAAALSGCEPHFALPLRIQ